MSLSRPQSEHEGTSLTAAHAGRIGQVLGAALEERDAAMLRAMGVRPSAMLRVCRVGEPTIVELVPDGPGVCRSGCRIGLARALAAKIRIS